MRKRTVEWEQLPVYAATIFVSAALLFAVQPIIAKQILPWFGGAAAVWITCMVFFQSALLGGYAYAHWLSQRRALVQVAVHSALLGVSLLLLPITPDAAFRPLGSEDPIGRILLLLLATIGLPFFLLSTTSPLLQAAFVVRYPSANVYRLYALSNTGSLLALLGYPLLIEPALSTRTQSIAWSLVYGLFAALSVACLASAARQSRGRFAAPHAPTITRATDGSSRTSLDVQVGWICLAAGGSMLLLAISNHLTQNVAPMPLLWVLPLAVYLLTYILAFEKPDWYQPKVFAYLSLFFTILLLAGLTFRFGGRYGVDKGEMPVEQAIPIFLAGLFVLCMFCHGELARRRPAARELTRFYLLAAAGSALGAMLIGVVAPLAFSGRYELPILLAVLTFAIGLAADGRARSTAIAVLIPSLALLGLQLLVQRADNVAMRRSFYGALQVRRTAPDTDPQAAWQLLHGVVLHGQQFRAAERKQQINTYYTASSGIGRLMPALGPEPRRVGVVGLGIGTLAAYGRSGDHFAFYELDPQVITLANEYFSFLRDSPARVEVMLGDARLSLERAEPQQYDVIAVDAFSGDSIPVHLLTREAMRQYRRHLKPGGVMAFHISNLVLDLAPIVQLLAEDVGMQAIRFLDVKEPEDKSATTSDWVLVSTDAQRLGAILKSGGGERLARDPQLRIWTDDYSNLVQVLKALRGGSTRSVDTSRS